VESKPPFDDAALEAFRKWKFKPGRDQNGQSVRVEVTLPIRFTLR
jgi:TonB family protein